MKKKTGWIIGLTLCLVAALVMMPFLQTKVLAAETANVQGTVASGTTAELLLLSTKDGKLEIFLPERQAASRMSDAIGVRKQ